MGRTRGSGQCCEQYINGSLLLILQGGSLEIPNPTYSLMEALQQSSQPIPLLRWKLSPWSFKLIWDVGEGVFLLRSFCWDNLTLFYLNPSSPWVPGQQLGKWGWASCPAGHVMISMGSPQPRVTSRLLKTSLLLASLWTGLHIAERFINCLGFSYTKQGYSSHSQWPLQFCNTSHTLKDSRRRPQNHLIVSNSSKAELANMVLCPH